MNNPLALLVGNLFENPLIFSNICVTHSLPHLHIIKRAEYILFQRIAPHPLLFLATISLHFFWPKWHTSFITHFCRPVIMLRAAVFLFWGSVCLLIYLFFHPLNPPPAGETHPPAPAGKILPIISPAGGGRGWKINH